MTERLGFMRWFDLLSGILLVVGGLWLGLVGLFGAGSIMGSVFGSSLVVRVVYVLIGIAAVYDILMIRAIPKRWHCSITPASLTEATG